MSFEPSKSLKAEVKELLTHYPKNEKRSASLMVLHAIQEEHGYVEPAAMEWAAGELGLQPINLYELVTFYPMLREAPAGRYVLKVCRTLSCAMAGGMKLHQHLCDRLKLDPQQHGLQTSADGKFSVEFAECLASCGTGPVMMCNDDFHEAVSSDEADQIMEGCE
ncbi:MAG: NAD(P)H-dependent oxidoreductase subunit E [Verrucomicrobiales bacterium]|nr:NAD(P)H-dependent oxidoreductase subunit E [Verrucomicrobiales bacterium]|tara:strand:+ start:712 stop:1203 length:492 start_codon:yes stop_codon:yes gene_type:complete